MNQVEVGCCSICGGRVTLPHAWCGVTQPIPTCDQCFATATNRRPVMPMEQRAQGAAAVGKPTSQMTAYEREMRAAHDAAVKPWPESYEPTEWVRSVVGRKWRGFDEIVYTCTAYDPRQGFWMDSATRCTNVSERAIGRTFRAQN